MVHRLIAGFCLVCLLSCLSAQITSQSVGPSDSGVKAAFVYNFAKFVEWPSGDSSHADSVFEICVLGESPIQGLLRDSIEGLQLKGREVSVRHVNDLDSLGRCDLLFVGESEKALYDGIIEKVADDPILTVGGSVGFVDRGGIIALFVRDHKVRFKINVAAAARAGLNISSKLLKLAESE